MSEGMNPIIWADFPDVDVIRVEDTYYMASTTMHMMPGGAILRSFDLIHWELASYLFEALDHTCGQMLQNGEHIYGKGMWAPSLRYNNGKFYALFCAWDTKKTYLYVAGRAEGPWERRTVDGFYHDASLLFDDGRIFIAYGNSDIYLTELMDDLSAPKPGGLNRLLVSERQNVSLGYEGSHLYKIGGRYFLFLIHWLKDGHCRRTEACFASDSLLGEFQGGDVLDDDMGYHNAGVAQGGIVDTKDGEWYAMLFQDHGAVGRIPVLVPVHWKDGFPVFWAGGRVPLNLCVKSTKPEHVYAPLYGSDDFTSLKNFWQWNHEPVNGCWSVTERPGYLRLYTDRLVQNVANAVNTLTQRTAGPVCEASVLLDGTGLREGDYAGLCVLQSHYGCIALTKKAGRFHIVMLKQGAYPDDGLPRRLDNDQTPAREVSCMEVESPVVEVRVCCDFRDSVDQAKFYYKHGGEWALQGTILQMHYLLDHFCGARFGLFAYSTVAAGGCADFGRFDYRVIG